MSAKDIFHDIVRTALEKDGWTITNDPLFLKLTQQFKINIDLEAEKFLVAEKATQKIAVEIKSFVGRSAVSEFHLAIGQFLNYRVALEKLASERVLYLAIPTDIYQDFFSDSFVQAVLERYQIKLLVFHVQKEEITLWKN
ncbi:MAG: fatty-acid oxidation protein subunit alpha [Okeania sp. SIO3I5]|uniref:XisH family protein n=1 Tax=Okeania sp. SIO3I5 TaxID=2607805 RepID=UPI0013B8EF7A|nr:XisH family protein [Okeania sp. SIO3I5]NEQ38539.1 fatty-acid oxidation protein subunit alpha [Okeania sp. SIO3I5]